MNRLSPNIARMLLKVTEDTLRPPALTLDDLSRTVEGMFVGNPTKAAKILGQLAGNAMRINLREDRRVIR